MKITRLIAKLEKAKKPNYELDRLITEVSGCPSIYRLPDGYIPRNGGFPEFTGSFDMAMMLAEKVTPGAPVIMGWGQTPQTRPWARVGAWNAADATGITPAIALCIAVLKAKQMGVGE